MSQRAVERVLGRLVTDEAYRDRFFGGAWATLPDACELTSTELEALRRLPRAALAALGARLDDRICRLNVRTTTEQEP